MSHQQRDQQARSTLTTRPLADITAVLTTALGHMVSAAEADAAAAHHSAVLLPDLPHGVGQPST